MTNAQRVRAVRIGRQLGIGHAPCRWLWSDEQNQFDTRAPVIKRHANAHKCNFTQLPGSANGRNSRKRRAQTANSRQEA